MFRIAVVYFCITLMSCSIDRDVNDASDFEDDIVQKNSIPKTNDSICHIDNKDIIGMVIKRDSIIPPTHGDKSIVCQELHISYDKNGSVIEKGCQGEYEGIGVPVGTWYKFRNNKLIQEIFYHNDEFGKDYILYKNYNEQGDFNEIVTNNFILYETDSIVLSYQEYLKRKK